MGALLGVITGVTMEPRIGRELEAGDNVYPVLDKDSLGVLWRLVGRGQEGAARKLQKSRIQFWNWARWGAA